MNLQLFLPILISVSIQSTMSILGKGFCIRMLMILLVIPQKKTCFIRRFYTEKNRLIILEVNKNQIYVCSGYRIFVESLLYGLFKTNF